MRLGKTKLSLSAAAVLAGSAALLLSGCGSSTTNGTSTPGNLKSQQVLHMAWGGSSGTQISAIDPGTASDTTVIPIVNLVFDGLVTLDQNSKTELWGADSDKVSTDGLTHTFHLRPNQKFSDGTPVQASDYVYGMTRSIDPCFVQATESPVAAYLDSTVAGATAFSDPSNCVAGAAKNPLTSIVADNSAGTVAITLGNTYGFFLDALTYSTSYALEAKAVTGANLGADETWTSNLTQGATGEGGSGEYYVSQYTKDGNLVLKQNPNWWGLSAGKKPYLTEIDYKIFADGDTQYAAYNTGTQFDENDGIPTAQLPIAKNQPDFHVSPLLAVQTVEMNFNIKPFDDVNARRAFCLAINRDDIVNNVLKGGQTPGYHLIPQGMPGYNPNLTGPEGVTATSGDLTKAQADWAAYKAAHPGAIPAIVYTADEQSAAGQALADKLAAQWNQAFPDAKVKVAVVDFHTRIAEENAKKLQFLRFGWAADYPDPEDFTTLLYDTHSAYNSMNVSDPAADALMEKADTDTGSDRLSLYQQAEQQLVNNVDDCPIYQYVNHYRVRTNIHNYVENSQGILSLDQWNKVYITNS